jgi:hypothetical protein
VNEQAQSTTVDLAGLVDGVVPVTFPATGALSFVVVRWYHHLVRVHPPLRRRGAPGRPVMPIAPS